MHQAFASQTPDELRRQASKLHALASHVRNHDVACRLREQAAALLFEAELKSLERRA
jgi:hypothetical protein